jgi:hypothetical protein
MQTTELLIRLGIPLPSAEQLRGVAMSKIIAFSETRSAERAAFRGAIETILEAVCKYADPNAQADYLSTKRTTIARAIKDLNEAIDELRVGAFIGVAKIAAPAGFTTLAAALTLSPVVTTIVAATGLAVSGISCFAETRGKLRQARTSSPYHYVNTVRAEFPI